MSDNTVSSKQDIVETVKSDPVILESVLRSPEVQAILIQQQRSHSGPLPPAEDVAVYHQYIPNGGDRLMKMAEKSLEMAEKQQDNQFELGKTYQKIQKAGQWFAFSAVALFSGLAGYIAYLGDTKAAAWLMGAGLASVVGAFLYQINKK